MSFIKSDSKHTTRLMPGDIIRFHRRHHLLSILRHGMYVLPNATDDRDDKQLMPWITGEIVLPFEILCRLMANAAGLTVTEGRHTNDYFQFDVKEEL